MKKTVRKFFLNDFGNTKNIRKSGRSKMEKLPTHAEYSENEKEISISTIGGKKQA